jgi:hypothetical protein
VSTVPDGTFLILLSGESAIPTEASDQDGSLIIIEATILKLKTIESVYVNIPLELKLSGLHQ